MLSSTSFLLVPAFVSNTVCGNILVLCRSSVSLIHFVGPQRLLPNIIRPFISNGRPANVADGVYLGGWPHEPQHLFFLPFVVPKTFMQSISHPFILLHQPSIFPRPVISCDHGLHMLVGWSADDVLWMTGCVLRMAGCVLWVCAGGVSAGGVKNLVSNHKCIQMVCTVQLHIWRLCC